jgi:hypothetical protein
LIFEDPMACYTVKLRISLIFYMPLVKAVAAETADEAFLPKASRTLYEKII